MTGLLIPKTPIGRRFVAAALSPKLYLVDFLSEYFWAHLPFCFPPTPSMQNINRCILYSCCCISMSIDPCLFTKFFNLCGTMLSGVYAGGFFQNSEQPPHGLCHRMTLSPWCLTSGLFPCQVRSLSAI